MLMRNNLTTDDNSTQDVDVDAYAGHSSLKFDVVATWTVIHARPLWYEYSGGFQPTQRT